MRAAMALSLCMLAAVVGLVGQARQADPLEFYKGYLAVLAKARTLDELVPFYVKELGDGLKKMPKEMQGKVEDEAWASTGAVAVVMPRGDAST